MSRIYDFYARDLLTPKEAAAYAGVSVSTIRQWVHRGFLEQAIPSEGRGVPALFNRPDLDEVKRLLAERAAAQAA